MLNKKKENNDTINLEKLKELLLDSELLEELKNKTDNSVNIFDILKVSKFEIRHSNMLAWLLDAKENHGLGDDFIKRFISYLAKRCDSDDEALKLLMSNATFTIRREWKNIDLLLISPESKIVIVIENKFGSGEHDGQLFRYKNMISDRFWDYQQYYLYLTLDGHISSDPDVWCSLGYENIIEWIELSLNTSIINSEVSQILKQYLSILRREIMGYSREVIELCNKIYEKHKDALDLIYENINERDDISNILEKWGEDWIENEFITDYDYNSSGMTLRTSNLENIFPQTNNNKYWPCYYTIARFPFPTQIYIEFNSQGFDEEAIERFQMIKPAFNEKTLKNNWQWHRLKTWKLPDYNLDESEKFEDVSNNLKIEIERIIVNEIPKFEEQLIGIFD